MNPMLSVVTGTYNRLPMLQRMIESARASVTAHIPTQFVVVDGGSTDGTQEWCEAQADVELIEQGELLGAIRAFCDGAKATAGRYVVLANDDIEFMYDSILRAFVHLESHPQCGAVAFADDRPARGKPPGFGVQTMTAIDPNGWPCVAPYAQVGMFRHWLGEAVGWWGADDPVFSGHTYGGDNYLSARIWESGFTVDAVKYVQVRDLVAPDVLRDRNHEIERTNPGAYHRRFPRGPRIGALPLAPQPNDETLRVLYLPIFEPGHPRQRISKRGLREAMIRRGFIVQEHDYLNNRTVKLPDLVEALQPHLMLTQLHDAVSLAVSVLSECRAKKADMVIVNWNGDARGLTDPAYLGLLKHVDVQLVLNAAALPVYAKYDIPAAYWQIGYESPLGALPKVPAHDVVFLGTCYNESRRALEKALLQLKSDGINVGLYGSGWQQPDGECLYDFDTAEMLMRRARIVISDAYNDGKTEVRGFVSNRLIQALGCGALVLQQHMPGLDEWNGLRAGTHYVEWRDLAEMQTAVRDVLANPDKWTKFRQEATADVDVSFDHRLDQLFGEILPKLEVDHVGA